MKDGTAVSVWDATCSGDEGGEGGVQADAALGGSGVQRDMGTDWVEGWECSASVETGHGEGGGDDLWYSEF